MLITHDDKLLLLSLNVVLFLVVSFIIKNSYDTYTAAVIKNEQGIHENHTLLEQLATACKK